MAAVKTFRPPFVWANQKTGLVEDPHAVRWTPAQIRAMKNGIYDWANHEEKRA